MRIAFATILYGENRSDREFCHRMNHSHNRYCFLLLIFSIVPAFLFLGSSSASAIILFESHSFAASKSEIAVSPDVFHCSEFKDGASLCKENFRYLGRTWRVSYRFMHNRLTQVLLFADYTQADRASLINALSSEFHLAALKSGRRVLDLVLLSGKKKGNGYKRTLARFEKMGLADSDLVYVFFEKAGLNRRAKKAKNIRDMMIKMSVLTREVDVWIQDSPEGKRIVLSFAMPRAAMRLKPHLERITRPFKKAPRAKVNTYTPPKPRLPMPGYRPVWEPTLKGSGKM